MSDSQPRSGTPATRPRPEEILEIALRAIVDLIRTGQLPAGLPADVTEHDQFQLLVSSWSSLQQFSLAISNGDLSGNLRMQGLLAGSLKHIQANLRHLTWQTQMVAAGNFSQRVDFLGEFSQAFNTMVDHLREARQQRQQHEAALSAINASLEQEIAERRQAEQALQTSNAELTRTLNHLRQTQAQLVESEKMAALGQLIAGVAHEINTPLGAVGAAVGAMTAILDQTLGNLPAFFQGLSQPEQRHFLTLLERARAPVPSLSAKEERSCRRSVARELAAQGIADCETIANLLIMMGIGDDVTPLVPLFREPHGLSILERAYQLSGLYRSARVIGVAADRAAKVVFALRNYAHFDRSGEMVQAHVIDGIETILTLYHSLLQRGVEVRRDYAEVPPLYCYPDELNQVWTNLIHNALQAMTGQGCLTIRVSCRDGQIMVGVTDTGPGIPAELQDKIFTPFFTTKPVGEGSGLGLHIAQKIVAKHAGTIRLDSEQGRGTTFEVSLPLLACAPRGRGAE